MNWLFCFCLICLVKTSLQQLNPFTNPYRPLLDQSNDYEGVPEKDIALEYKIDKMPSRTYDWSYVAAGTNWARAVIKCLMGAVLNIYSHILFCLGGRHTCAIKSGVGWTDGVDYKDRLFCFGRNVEGQLDPPIEMSTAAWEMVYESF